MYKNIGVLSAATFFCLGLSAQQISSKLSGFNKIRVSAHINVVLNQGDAESLRIEYKHVEKGMINYGVKHNTLEIYLDQARITDKMVKRKDGSGWKESYYKDAEITAYITYREIVGIEMRGDQSGVCKDNINADKFTLKLYGESHLSLAHVNAKELVGKLYGENNLEVKSGHANRQTYKLYGENHIATGELTGDNISYSLYGDNSLINNASKKIVVFGFGDAQLSYSGEARVKKLMIGTLRVDKEL